MATAEASRTFVVTYWEKASGRLAVAGAYATREKAQEVLRELAVAGYDGRIVTDGDRG